MSTLRTALVACSVALWSLSAAANGQFSFGGPDAKAVVIMRPDIQKELKLTGDQKKRINAELSKMGQPGQATMNFGLQGGPMAALDGPVLAILEPEQVIRFEQLYIQYEGPCALQRDEIAAKVPLTPEQAQKIKDIFRESQEEFMRVLQANGGRVSQGSMKELKKSFKKCSEASMALLTPEQAAAFLAMQGKPAKIHPRDL